MNITKLSKKLTKFAFDNYLISAFIAIVLFVIFVTGIKILTTEENYIYAKVKVSQGLWWANTNRPNLWLANAINKGDKEGSLTGKPIAEILEARVYPWFSSDQYDIFITAKLKVDKNKRTGKYSYKRSQIAVGSPIDFEFPLAQFSATVMAISDKPFEDNYIEKIVTLRKDLATPSEATSIQVGDTLFDGENTVFEIMDKSVVNSYSLYSSLGNNYPLESERKVNIAITTKILVKSQNGNLIFGEEQVVKPGATIRLSTPNFFFDGYQVERVK